jgi:hypothetical protein
MTSTIHTSQKESSHLVDRPGTRATHSLICQSSNKHMTESSWPTEGLGWPATGALARRPAAVQRRKNAASERAKGAGESRGGRGASSSYDSAMAEL